MFEANLDCSDSIPYTSRFTAVADKPEIIAALWAMIAVAMTLPSVLAAATFRSALRLTEHFLFLYGNLVYRHH